MKKYIIFGAGRYGEEALLYYGIANVAYFCDNRKCGKTIWGVEVISFGKLCEIWSDYEVVLAVWSANNRREMVRQLEDNSITYSSFQSLETYAQDDNFTGEYHFTDRSKGKEKLLIVLAGYKPYLWESVFARVKRYVSTDMDVCVLTAGYENEEFVRLCDKEGWSYLYSEENKLALVQNLAIREHSSAKWIYKMDEDIFLTEGVLEELYDTYQAVEREQKYRIGFVAPMMAVNSYGYRKVLEHLGCLDEYCQIYDEAYYGGGKVFSDPAVAMYLWDKTLPIDNFARGLKNRAERYAICYHRFSIGCILIARSTWKSMGGFKNAPEGVLGIDEEHLCMWCMNASRAIIVAEHAYAGHFAFGPQTEQMKRMYETRRAEFDR